MENTPTKVPVLTHMLTEQKGGKGQAQCNVNVERVRPAGRKMPRSDLA